MATQKEYLQEAEIDNLKREIEQLQDERDDVTAERDKLASKYQQLGDFANDKLKRFKSEILSGREDRNCLKEQISGWEKRYDQAIAERDHALAERDDYKEMLAIHVKQEQDTVERMGKLIIAEREKTARRAVEVCERMAYRFEIGDECFDCANALRAEFGLVN